MSFNIHQQVFDRDGIPLEKKARQYYDQLVQLFEQSLMLSSTLREAKRLNYPMDCAILLRRTV